jgi:hypothetical protein
LSSLTFPEIWKFCLACLLVFSVLFFSLLLKKDRDDLCRELLLSTARPGDILLVSSGLELDLDDIDVSSVLVGRAFEINFQRHELSLVYKKEGRVRSLRLKDFPGRVLFLSGADSPVHAAGRMLTVPLEKTVLGIVHPLAVEKAP